MPNIRTLGMGSMIKNFEMFAEVLFALYSNVTVNLTDSVYSNVILNVAYSNVMVGVCSNFIS